MLPMTKTLDGKLSMNEKFENFFQDVENYSLFLSVIRVLLNIGVSNIECIFIMIIIKNI